MIARLCSKLALLLANVFSTNKHRGAHAHAATNLLERFVNLNGKLAGWQMIRPRPLNVGQALDHGNTEREGFTGTRLRNTNNVFSVDGDRNSLQLDWRGAGEVVLLERRKDTRRDTKGIERVGRCGFRSQ